MPKLIQSTPDVPETINISIIANEVSTRILAPFGWGLAGSFDTNYKCLNEEHDLDTHPYDCVFTYEDVRQKKTVYLLTDLKSYSAKTLKSRVFRSTLQSLAKAVECAKISNEWKSEVGIDDDSTCEIYGLLFIYNHDQAYDTDFKKHLESISNVDLDLPEGTPIFVLGPNDINFLENIHHDLKRLATDFRLGETNHFKYFYPRKILKPIPDTSLDRLPIELLLSPFIIISYDHPHFDQKGHARGYVVYYRGKGETIDEFHYLLNYLLTQRLLSSDHEICIRAPYLSDKADSNLSNARNSIVAQYHDMREFKKRLEEIRLERMPRTVQVYSSDKIGLDRKNRKSK